MTNPTGPTRIEPGQSNQDPKSVPAISLANAKAERERPVLEFQKNLDYLTELVEDSRPWLVLRNIDERNHKGGEGFIGWQAFWMLGGKIALSKGATIEEAVAGLPEQAKKSKETRNA